MAFVIEPTHLNSLAVHIVKTLEARGYDRQALLRQAGIGATELDKADGRLPSLQVDRLWQVAMESSGDDWSIMIDVAKRYDVGSWHAIGFGLHACANLIEVSERMTRASVIFNTALVASCACAGGEFQVTFEFMYPGAVYPKDISTMAIVLQVWRSVSRPDLAPLSVQFANVDMPANAAMDACLQDFFGCPVSYRQKHNCLTLALADAREALPAANAVLAARGEAVVDEYLNELSRSAIASAVVRCIADGVLEKESVARRLNMSPRTLQRRLNAEQLSFTQLLAETRRELAGTHLRSGRFTVKEVAYMLGYSDPANFSRAFRTWYGVTPDEFRQGEQPQGGPSDEERESA